MILDKRTKILPLSH